jgi:hypothetical protein
MSNTKNTKFYKISDDKQTVPASANKTGTISTQGTAVIGVGTLFKTEMQAGSWLTDLANNELRKVLRVESNVLAYLESAFQADIAALTTPNIVANTSLNIRELSVIIPLVNSAGTAYAFGELDGTELESGLPVTFGKASKDNENSFSYIDPIEADATGTVINVTTLK